MAPYFISSTYSGLLISSSTFNVTRTQSIADVFHYIKILSCNSIPCILPLQDQSFHLISDRPTFILSDIIQANNMRMRQSEINSLGKRNYESTKMNIRLKYL